LSDPPSSDCFILFGNLFSYFNPDTSGYDHHIPTFWDRCLMIISVYQIETLVSVKEIRQLGEIHRDIVGFQGNLTKIPPQYNFM